MAAQVIGYPNPRVGSSDARRYGRRKHLARPALITSHKENTLRWSNANIIIDIGKAC